MTTAQRAPNLLIGGYNIDKGLEWSLWGLLIGRGGGGGGGGGAPMLST